MVSREFFIDKNAFSQLNPLILAITIAKDLIITEKHKIVLYP